MRAVVSSATICATGVADDGSPVRCRGPCPAARRRRSCEHGVQILAELHLLERRADLPRHLARRREALIGLRCERAMDDLRRTTRARRRAAGAAAAPCSRAGACTSRSRSRRRTACGRRAPPTAPSRTRTDRYAGIGRLPRDDLRREVAHLALHDAGLGRLLRAIAARARGRSRSASPCRAFVSSTLCGETSRWTTGSGAPSGPVRSCAAARPRRMPTRDSGDQLPARRLVAADVPADPGAEIDAVDPLEDHVVVAAVVDEVVNLGDVRRLQHRAEARFLDEHRHVRRLRCEVLVHLLDGDVADEARSRRARDRARHRPCRRAPQPRSARSVRRRSALVAALQP